MTHYRESMRQTLERMYEINSTKRDELIASNESIDEGMSSGQIAKLKKAYEPMRGKRISADNAFKLQGLMDKFDKDKNLLIQLFKADIPFVSSLASARLITRHNMKGAEINKLKEEMEFWEELELEEKKILVANPKTQEVIKIDEKDWPKYEKKGYVQAEETELEEKKILVANPKTQEVIKIDEKDWPKYEKKGWVQAEETELGEAISKSTMYGVVVKGEVIAKGSKAAMSKLAKQKGGHVLNSPAAKVGDSIVSKDGIRTLVKKEEVELDEKTKWRRGDGRPRGAAHIENERFWDLPKSELEYIIKDAGEAMKALPSNPKNTTGKGNYSDQINDAHTVLGWRRKNNIKEEVELDEASFKIKDDVVYISKDEYISLPAEGKGKDEKGNPTLNIFMTDDDEEGPTPLPVKFVNESARSDAMKAMRKSGEFKDKDDDDIRATDADVKAASKNILMQMKSAADLSKGGEIEFLDKKKIKVPQKVAQLFVRKYMSLRRPADKAKFQAKAVKSYKGFVSAMKEGVESEHTILDRIHDKIQERKNV